MHFFSRITRTKIVLFIALALVCLFGYLTVSMMRANTSAQTASSPEVITSKFYNWYLHNIDTVSDTSINDPNMQKYVTTELLHQLDLLAQLREMELTVTLTDEQYSQLELDELTLDSDYFTKAQACFEDWADNINISSAQILTNTAIVKVSSKGLPQNDCPLNLSIALVKEENLWKIRSVKSIDKK